MAERFCSSDALAGDISQKMTVSITVVECSPRISRRPDWVYFRFADRQIRKSAEEGFANFEPVIEWLARPMERYVVRWCRLLNYFGQGMSGSNLLYLYIQPRTRCLCALAHIVRLAQVHARCRNATPGPRGASAP